MKTTLLLLSLLTATVFAGSPVKKESVASPAVATATKKTAVAPAKDAEIKIEVVKLVTSDPTAGLTAFKSHYPNPSGKVVCEATGTEALLMIIRTEYTGNDSGFVDGIKFREKLAAIGLELADVATVYGALERLKAPETSGIQVLGTTITQSNGAESFLTIYPSDMKTGTWSGITETSSPIEILKEGLVAVVPTPKKK